MKKTYIYKRNLNSYIFIFLIILSYSELRASDNIKLFNKSISENEISNVFEGSVNLTSQSDVDDFGSYNYTEITGSLSINGSNIISLQPLLTIEIIGSNFSLSNYSNNSEIDILQNLITVGGLFYITNSNLKFESNLFPSLTSVHNSVRLMNNMNQSFNSFNNLIMIGEDLRIIDNNFTSLVGFESLTAINQDLVIMDNESIVTAGGFNNLQNVESIKFENNNSLQLINGFSSINEISNDLIIRANGSLISVLGFSNLTTINRALEIFYNQNIEFLSGLENIILIGGNFNMYNGVVNFSNNQFNFLQNVGGDFSIFSTTSTDDFNSFNNLESINGYLGFNDNNFETMSGFNSLQTVGSELDFTSGGFLIIGGFESLNNVGGNIFIAQEDNLQNITGFNNLITLNFDFILQSHSNLNEVTGFQSLVNIEGNFIIRDNSSNLSFSSFTPQLLHVGGNLEITGNYLIQNICGFNNLNNVAGALVVSYNDIVTNLCGFNALETVSSLIINGNYLLSTLNGFNSLLTIDDRFFIWENFELINIDGFNNLTEVYQLNIYRNLILDNLNFLSNITDITSDLGISENSSLSECSIEPICEHISENGSYFIQNNATGCNSSDEILAGCILSINQSELQNISIFPNPTRNILYVDAGFKKIYKLEVFNDLGQSVKYEYFQKEISIFDLKSGLYIVKVFFDDGSNFIGKVVKI